MMKPFQQGDLDGLCGIYAVINALQIIHSNKRISKAELLFWELFNCLLSKKNPDFIVTGTTSRDISMMLKHAKNSKDDFRYRKPFHTRPNVTIDVLWKSMSAFLNEGDQRAIIISFEDEIDGHWTVIKAITPSRILLQDSGFRSFLRKKHLSTNADVHEASKYLLPTSAFYIDNCGVTCGSP